MSIEERFISDVVYNITYNTTRKRERNQELIDKLHNLYVSNGKKVSAEEINSLFGIDRDYKIEGNDLFNEDGKAIIHCPTKEELEKVYEVLKDFFNNGFKDRIRYFKTNNITPMYSDELPEVIKGCHIELKERDWETGGDLNIVSDETGENVYDTYEKVKNMVLKDEEQKEFFKMLEWYVMNVPYSDWDPINFDSTFMFDVAYRYYNYAKEKGEDVKHLEKYLIIFDESRVTQSRHFGHHRIGWKAERYYTINDNYRSEKYYDHKFLSYSDEGITAEWSIPRFYVKDLYLSSISHILVDNNGRFFDICTNEYVDGDIVIKPLMCSVADFGYNDILENFAINGTEQIHQILTFIQKLNDFDINLVKSLCQTTAEDFTSIAHLERYFESEEEIQKAQREFELSLIIDYYLNDGDFYYGFNYDDRRDKKANHFDTIFYVDRNESICDIYFKDDKVTYYRFFGEKVDLCHVEDGKVINDYGAKQAHY